MVSRDYEQCHETVSVEHAREWLAGFPAGSYAQAAITTLLVNERAGRGAVVAERDQARSDAYACLEAWRHAEGAISVASELAPDLANRIDGYERASPTPPEGECPRHGCAKSACEEVAIAQARCVERLRAESVPLEQWKELYDACHGNEVRADSAERRIVELERALGEAQATAVVQLHRFQFAARERDACVENRRVTETALRSEIENARAERDQARADALQVFREGSAIAKPKTLSIEERTSLMGRLRDYAAQLEGGADGE